MSKTFDGFDNLRYVAIDNAHNACRESDIFAVHYWVEQIHKLDKMQRDWERRKPKFDDPLPVCAE